MTDTLRSIDDRDEHTPRTIYGVEIAKEEIVEIHQISDRMLGIVRPNAPATEGAEPQLTWKLARDIHMLEASSYEEARAELETVRDHMVGIGTLETPSET